MWSNVLAGTFSLGAVATDDRGRSATSAPVRLTGLAATNVPTLAWSNSVVYVNEGELSVTLHVVKNANSAAASLSYFTRDDSATALQPVPAK